MLAIPILKRAYRIRCVSKSDDIDPFAECVQFNTWKKIGRGWVSSLL